MPFDSKLYSSNHEAGDFFGVSVSLNINRLAVGAAYNDQNGTNSGSVTLFKYEDDWEEQQILLAPDGQEYDLFGNDIDIYNNRLIVGAYHKDDIYMNSGAVYIYTLLDDLFNFSLKRPKILSTRFRSLTCRKQKDAK